MPDTWIQAHVAEIAEINEANGWYDKERTFGDDVALLHSEVSELFEEFRAGADPRTNRYVLKVSPGSPVDIKLDGMLAEAEGPFGELTDPAFQGVIDQLRVEEPTAFKPEGIPSEMADILIRLLDTAGRYGVNLDSAVREKLAYNRTRGHRHGGKVV